MKRLLTFVLCFTLTTNVVFAGNADLLKNVVDEYNYSLAVEWDQKDQKFYDQKTQDFFSQLSILILEKGLTREDILEFLDRGVKDKFALEMIKTRLYLSSSKDIKPQEIADIFRETNQAYYQRGASWIDGEVLLYIGGGLVVAALIGYAVWFAINYECVRHDYVKECGYVSSTRDGPRHYDCWYDYECVEYQKKN